MPNDAATDAEDDKQVDFWEIMAALRLPAHFSACAIARSASTSQSTGPRRKPTYWPKRSKSCGLSTTNLTCLAAPQRLFVSAKLTDQRHLALYFLKARCVIDA